MTSSDTISFGPPTSQWHYHRPTKTYDLSRRDLTTRGHGQGLTISTTQGPPDSHITISPSISALVVVDMQNFFLHPRCRDHPLGLKAVNPTIKVIEKCREVGIQVIWLNWGLTDTNMATMPAGVQRGFSRDLIAGIEDKGPKGRLGLGAELGENQGRCLFAGAWNADIYEPLKIQVKPEDIHCAKNRISGMWNEEQPLWKYLERAGKKTLLFTGVNTDQCVLGTLNNAYNAGWDCVMVEDCCATTTPSGKEVCLHNIGNSYGFVVDSKKFVDGKLEI